MPAALGPVYFTDENALGLGKLHRAGRDDVLYPGHENLAEVPLGTPDLDWMPEVARRELMVSHYPRAGLPDSAQAPAR